MSSDSSRSRQRTASRPTRLGLSMRRPGLPPAPIGLLENLGSTFRFRYVSGINAVDDFRPVIGFPDVHRVYTSSSLFPFFAQRVLQPDRPDFAEYLDLLKLPDGVSEWDLLARSGGTRKGDRYEVLGEPQVDRTGRLLATFFVRGLRFSPEGEAGVEARLSTLPPGVELVLRQEATNVVNPAAQQLCDHEGFAFGWVPDLLLPCIRVGEAASWTARVVAVNGPASPWHLRLLVAIEGRVSPGFRLMDEQMWAPVQVSDDAHAQPPMSVA